MMSPTRFQQLWSGTNGAARKVYDSVPAQEDWTAAQIAGDLSRRDSPMAFAAIQGCLESLRTSGLIRQGKHGFRREQVRSSAPARVVSPANMAAVLHAEPQTPPPQQVPPEPPAKKEALMTTPAAVASVPSPSNVVDSISTLAQNLAAMAQRHAQEMQDLANKISDAAIDVQTDFERTDADFARMRQLQTLLKDFAR